MPRQPDWLDASQPHEPHRSEAQVRGVVELLKNCRGRVLELGCGCGRTLVPLAAEGHQLTGIDRDREALAQCRESLDEAGIDATLIQDDFTAWLRKPGDSFSAVLCLGNTFMAIADLDAAIEVLDRARRLLAPKGLLVIDDLPQDLWPELTEGNWQSGMSEDGDSQLVWHPDDAVFTLRQGEAVDPDSWSLKPDDALYRLWTSSALRMSCRLAGLSEPEHLGDAGLLVLRPNS